MVMKVREHVSKRTYAVDLNFFAVNWVGNDLGRMMRDFFIFFEYGELLSRTKLCRMLQEGRLLEQNNYLMVPEGSEFIMDSEQNDDDPCVLVHCVAEVATGAEPAVLVGDEEDQFCLFYGK